MKKATSDRMSPKRTSKRGGARKATAPKELPCSSEARKRQAETKALAAMPDDDIDTDDIPEVRDWTGAKRGTFYRPIKQQITLRLDADIINWFKQNAPDGRGYQTDINRVLRAYVDRHDEQSE